MGTKRNAMLIASALLSASTVASLARRLQCAGQLRLADDVGRAVDADWNELQLAPNEEATILSVLHDCPAPLRPLRDALEANARRRSARRSRELERQRAERLT